MRKFYFLLGLVLFARSDAFAYGGKLIAQDISRGTPDCRSYLCKIDPSDQESSQSLSLNTKIYSHDNLEDDLSCFKSLESGISECATFPIELQDDCYAAVLKSHTQVICIGFIRPNDAE